MDVELALKTIEEWYGDESYVVIGFEDDAPIDCLDSTDTFDPCPTVFEDLVGRQFGAGYSGDDYYGRIYFKIPNGGWIDTEFFS